MKTTRIQRRLLMRENTEQPVILREVPQEEWPQPIPPNLFRLWRSMDFLVQEFRASHPALVRLSICRTSLNDEGRWRDGISWDDLQRLKRECGYGDLDAVEVFPADGDIVCVANMRHIFIMRDHVPFAWRKKP